MASSLQSLGSNAEYVVLETAGNNAVLNELAERIEFRVSDKIAALTEQERFDYVRRKYAEWTRNPQIHLPRLAPPIDSLST